jgi:hypothetical protein
MEQDNKRVPLDDVLGTYAISEPGPSYMSLVEWIRRYPYYEQELTTFVADWALATWLPTPASIHDVDEEALVHQGMSIVQDILQQQESDLQSGSICLAGIVQEGARLNLSIQQLAERAQMSRALVRKLDLRLIRFSTIPRQAIEALAHAVARESSVVADYLQGSPTLPQGANYRAEKPPVLSEPEDFFTAVDRDMSMSPELRTFWLSFAPPDAR